MKRKPIYVEVDIKAPMDQIWLATQTPNLHEKWDLRFSSISYLPKKDNEPQHFIYTRKLVFGKKIEGWGISTGSHNGKDGSRSSALHFGTDQRTSPIKEGRGYWKYIPTTSSVKFLTLYNYDVNFGKIGELFDALLFRPLMGWGTALSFDVLRRWLEKEETPSSQYLRFFLSWMFIFIFSFIWIYHGLVPKLVFQHADEYLMLTNLVPISQNTAFWIVIVIGIMEVLFGVLWLFYKKKSILFGLQIILFPLLGLSAMIADPVSLSEPFNPLTFNLSLWSVSIAGYFCSKDLPTAKNCKRKR